MTVLVFDTGGTRLNAGLAGPDGLWSHAIVPTDVSSADALVALTAALRRRLLHRVRPSAIGVSVKGIVDSLRGSVVEVNAPLEVVSGELLTDQLPQALGVPVCVENDARVCALSELRHGAGHGAENLVGLTLGTGIGVEIVIDGRLCRRGRGALGILAGHLTVDVDRRACGSIGDTAALVGAAELAARACETA